MVDRDGEDLRPSKRIQKREKSDAYRSYPSAGGVCQIFFDPRVPIYA